MRWSPLGKIFDPRDFQLPLRCVEFAQAPQALVLEDRVRVYFSSRSVDSPGNFISHICFVDFSLDWRSIIAVSEEQVVPNGELGTFDEHGTFPMNILATEDVVYGFTTGWSRRVSVSVDTAIGLVVSKDGGNSFKKLGPGPILGPTKTEPFLVADGCVVRDTGAFHMWYIFGSHWIAGARDGVPERVYKTPP